ncbi:hypothetical protein P7D58_02490 [Enterococcus avium]|uniref:hypothetical protein n=1 Tax=Enterococcus avium TaxID=33945 RepID=UPI00288D8792|nr:hypothetical protein [Enterococcus avium]MDT2392772.1 hypothetical protein [Enterococcus avium]MDT2416592.1 hypothetical protein [Enterococcus avium]MDT2429874.1 hypothetical protein [Enterococcus avium]MDT2438910.1 hypothetical protein [Enterococcus avium]MDT2451980.1 hypothetical protein [Enterococcus avium]
MRFQWLKDFQEIDEHILYLKWNLNKSKLELERWTNGDLANVKLEKNSRGSNLEEKILQIEREIECLVEQKDEMKLIIDSFTGLDNQIMNFKYIKGMTLEMISEETGYSVSYIQKKHAELRKSVDYLDAYLLNKSDLKMKLAVQSEEKLHKNCTNGVGFRLG